MEKNWVSRLFGNFPLDRKCHLLASCLITGNSSMDTADLQPLKRKVILDAGYERTLEGYTLVFIVNGKEWYMTSQTPIELDVRDIH